MKENLSQGMSFDSAVNEAVDFAIKGDFLEGFFREKRMKILDDIYTEFDQESYDETLRNDGRIEGARENAIANAKILLEDGKYSAEEIRAALQNNELTTYYQPQYDALTSQLKSAEALVRWIKPDGTVISPFFFIPVAEESDLIMDIDWYVTELVCKTLEKQNMMPQFPISINFSRKHIQEDNFAERLTAIVDKYDLPHPLIEVEITESAMVGEEERILNWIVSIRNAGFTVEAILREEAINNDGGFEDLIRLFVIKH